MMGAVMMMNEGAASGLGQKLQAGVRVGLLGSAPVVDRHGEQAKYGREEDTPFEASHPRWCGDLHGASFPSMTAMISDHHVPLLLA